MKKLCRAIIPSLALVAASGLRAEDVADTWNRADMYPDLQAWEAAGRELESSAGGIEGCRGRLGESAAELERCLDLIFGLTKEFQRYFTWASTGADEDLRDQDPGARRQVASQLGTRLGQAASYMEPELIAVGPEKLKGFLGENPGLGEYDFFIENTLRKAEHTLEPQAEEVIAAAGNVRASPYGTYNVLTAADVPWPTITLADGTEARLDQAGYGRWRSAPHRADRKAVFDAFFGTHEKYERTLGATLSGGINSNVFEARVRGYPSAVEAALAEDNIPVSVYRTLVEQANENLATLHRYLRLRARMLDIDELAYYDLYTPIVALDKDFPLAEAKKIMIESFSPLGEEYVGVVRRGLAERWMDAYPRQGKQSGAYVNGAAYDVHPYVLTNYTDDYDTVSTMAHEWGHAIHSHLANTTQPFPKANYATFTAEIASTFNEALLLDYMLKGAKNDDERLYYLGFALEGIRTTFFRQTMFAEFELAIHEAVERGEALTGQRLTEMYAELLRRYHGHDDGVLRIHDAYTIEWAYVPHFYFNFYVFQYATSLAASSLLAQDVLDGERGARDRYLGLLKAGGSAYPYELLRDAGVDMATAEPYQATFRRMNDIMAQIEAILDRRGS